MMVACTKRVFLTRDHLRLVAPENPDAAVLFAAVGQKRDPNYLKRFDNAGEFFDGIGGASSAAEASEKPAKKKK